MTDPVPSKELTESARAALAYVMRDGYDAAMTSLKADIEAAAKRQSKERDIADELLEAVTVLDEPFHREAVAGTIGRAAGVIKRLRDDLDELHDAHDALERELDRLRTALTGISTCSTCEACRGAATRALGGEQPPRSYPRVCGVSRLDLGGRRGDEVTVTLEHAPTDTELAAIFDTLTRAAQPPGDG